MMPSVYLLVGRELFQGSESVLTSDNTISGRATVGAMTAELLLVTQVAPYRDGPAGAHRVLDQARRAITALGSLHNLRVVATDDVVALQAGPLETARVLVLFTIGETPWSQTQRAIIERRLRSGALAVVAIHSATDSCYGWDAFGAIVGARFDGHPWTTTCDLEVVERAHPACRHLDAHWRWHDEVYQFRDLRSDARVLLRAPEEQLDMNAAGVSAPSFGYPLSWCFEHDSGRVFSTSLGHFPEAWESTVFLEHISGGIAWVLEDGA